MIYIDFQGGAHGNYLEFVCNKFLAGVTNQSTPFNKLGSAHNKVYHKDRVFHCGHYSNFYGDKTPIKNSQVISIQITANDLLPLTSISLLRADDFGYDNNQLETDTYHKLNNITYKWMLDQIVAGFFTEQIQRSYREIKAPNWPDISCVDDLLLLPDLIRQECLEVHNLKLLCLDKDHPHCPRSVLREFFKLGFKHPEQSGFLSQQAQMTYDPSNQVLLFPFSSFYDTTRFLQQMELVAQWSGFEIQQPKELHTLHQEFLTRQPYKDSKKLCDHIVNRICEHEHFDLPALDLLQESYISACLETEFGIELSVDMEKWFSNSQQILEFIV